MIAWTIFPELSASPDRLIFADYQFYGTPLASVRRGELKLIFDASRGTYTLRRTCLPCRPDGEPGELSEDATALDELKAALVAHIRGAEELKGSLRSRTSVPRDEVWRELESLGYVR